MSNQWFVHSNDQEMGPFTDEQLVAFVQEGSVTADTLIWAEGMPEWAPASQVEGLIPEDATPAEPNASAPLETAGPLESEPEPEVVESVYPYLPTKPASFAFWLWTLLGGFICIILSAFVFSVSAKAAFDAQAAGAEQDAVAAAASGQILTGTIFMGIGMLCLLISAIFFYINIYRAWKCLSAGEPRTTPGKAVGLLFIPFFNLYWIFIAIAALPKDWNRIMASYEDLQKAPKLSGKIFLMFCIGSLVFPPLALVVGFPLMSQTCKGINFFASRRNPNAPSAFGGFKFS